MVLKNVEILMYTCNKTLSYLNWRKQIASCLMRKYGCAIKTKMMPMQKISLSLIPANKHSNKP